MSSVVCNVVLCISAVMLTLSPRSIESVVAETSSCGQSLANFRAKIINGQVSPRGWWPWQIAIYKVPNFHCGGALISRRWVLTAAHCFYHGRYFMSNTNLYQIKAGDHNLSVYETSQQEIPLQRIFVHPRFKPKGVPYFDGDLALVKLSQEVKLGEFVRTVCLPEKNEGDLAIPNKRGTVAGWGVTRPLKLGERGSLDDVSKVLRHATFTIKSDQLCKNKSGILFNSTTAFCAGDGEVNSDSCQGDSGGAFVRKIRNSKWVVVGVVSWGSGCAQKDQYGYYTRIHPFLDWVRETMETEDSSTCGPPTPPRGSRIIHPAKQERYEKGSVVLFGCKQGFYLAGKPIRKCLGSTWTQRKFRCVGFCPDLRPILNGRVIDTSPSIDQASVEFRCNENFRLVGRSRLECIDGRWNGKLPFCETTLCSKPAIPSNSYIIYPPITQVNYTHGTHVFLACRDGHYLKGSPIMVCNQTVWFKREFSCIASCPVIASIMNGVITHATLRQGGEIEIKCRPEYTLVGPSKLRCIEGKWNDSLPLCKASCPDPGHPENGQTIGRVFGHDSVVEFECLGDRLLQGSSQAKCNNGQWDQALPTCRAPCPDPGVPANGNRDGDDFKHAKSVTFSCKEDYELEGDATISCDNGDWTRKAPLCKVITCEDPGSPLHGRQSKVTKNFTVGGIVRFKCSENYTMEGIKKLTCLKSKTWKGEMPKCLASCPDPGHPQNGQTIGRVFGHDSVVKFECLGDRLLQGSSQAKCNNGQWDQALPTCRDCGTGLPLGMESRKISDTSIRASSHSAQHPAHDGRLGGDNYWCSEEGKTHFIEIDLPKSYKITEARIQLQSTYKIKSIILKAKILNEWANFHYEKVSYNKEMEQIKPKHPFIAQSVRIRVLSKRSESICLRAEVYGCVIPRGCIMRGSAVLIKQGGRYQRGYVGEYIDTKTDQLEVRFPGKDDSIIVVRADVIPDEKPDVHELAIGKLVLGKDAASPGVIRNGKIEQITDSVYTIKTNDETWKSGLRNIRIVKMPALCT